MKVYYDNGKPLLIIGFKESSLSGYLFDHFMKIPGRESSLVTPDNFFKIENKNDFQYGVAFNKDRALRNKILTFLKNNELNCPSFIHEQASVQNSTIGHGTTIFPFCTIYDAVVGDYCILEPYTLLVHHSIIGNNVHTHPGTIIGGRTTIGNNCVFNLRATVLPKMYICDNVEVGAVSTVTKNITNAGRYVGTIARRVGDLSESIY